MGIDLWEVLNQALPRLIHKKIGWHLPFPNYFQFVLPIVFRILPWLSFLFSLLRNSRHCCWGSWEGQQLVSGHSFCHSYVDSRQEIVSSMAVIKKRKKYERFIRKKGKKKIRILDCDRCKIEAVGLNWDGFERKKDLKRVRDSICRRRYIH